MKFLFAMKCILTFKTYTFLDLDIPPEVCLTNGAFLYICAYGWGGDAERISKQKMMDPMNLVIHINK